MENCIFCKIVKKEIKSNIVYETDNLIVFPDIDPHADTHLLIVPKEHIKGIENIGTTHGDLLGQVFEVAKKLVKDYNLEDSAYRVAVNGGKAQGVPHLHFHFLGGIWKKLI